MQNSLIQVTLPNEYVGIVNRLVLELSSDPDSEIRDRQIWNDLKRLEKKFKNKPQNYASDWRKSVLPTTPRSSRKSSTKTKSPESTSTGKDRPDPIEPKQNVAEPPSEIDQDKVEVSTVEPPLINVDVDATSESSGDVFAPTEVVKPNEDLGITKRIVVHGKSLQPLRLLAHRFNETLGNDTDDEAPNDTVTRQQVEALVGKREELIKQYGLKKLHDVARELRYPVPFDSEDIYLQLTSEDHQLYPKYINNKFDDVLFYSDRMHKRLANPSSSYIW